MTMIYSKDNEVNPSKQSGLLKPTLLITFFSIIDVIISFLLQIILAAKFGTGFEMDSYLAAMVLPTLITAVFLSSLNVTFIPIFIEYETKKNKTEAWKVASIFTNLTFFVLSIICCLGVIFTPQIVSITTPGFKAGDSLLIVSLLRILLISLVFSGLNTLMSSLYYAHHRFFRPTITPIVKIIIITLFIVIFEQFWGIKSIAFGTLLGSIACFFILIPIFFKDGRYTLSFNFLNRGVTQIIRVMMPLILAGLFYRSTTLIERMIASTLPKGSISYLGYASNILAVLGTITTAGISITIFPSMARSWAEKNLAQVREYFAKGVRVIMLTTFPVAVIFAILRVPIIQLFLERGEFDHTATLAVANIILIELIGFICGGLGSVVAKGFYISQRTKLGASVSVIATLVYLGISYILVKRFSYIGLAIALSVYYALGLIVSTFVMKIIYKGINGICIARDFLKILSASSVTAVCIYFSFNLIPSGNSMLFRSSIAVILGMTFYIILVIYIFKINEAILLKEKIIAKIKRKTDEKI